MLRYLVYLIFILSVALAAGGVILSTKLRTRYHHSIFSILLYFQVFIYAFGFYGIWGQALIRLLLTDFISPDLLSRISETAIFLGLPFMVFAWLMLLQFSISISGRDTGKWFPYLFLIFNFSVLSILGYIAAISDTQPADIVKNYYLIMNLSYSLLGASVMFFSAKGVRMLRDYEKRIIAPLLILVAVIQNIPLLFYTSETYIALVFIFTFFLGNTFLPVFLTYGKSFPWLSENYGEELTLDEFCKKYEVSPRETDIIREICSGLSNKEISDKLFISLQTVKDHTHRIFIKTNVKSRVQLINLVKGEGRL